MILTSRGLPISKMSPNLVLGMNQEYIMEKIKLIGGLTLFN